MQKAVEFLYNAVPKFEGVIAEKRVYIFKGSSASTALLSPLYKQKVGKNGPVVSSKEEAEDLLTDMLDEGIFLRAAPIQNSIRFFEPDVSRDWSEDAFYVWIYEGSQLKTILGGAGLLVLALTFVMFPLWPGTLRTIVWYLGMLLVAFIVFLFVTAIVRLIVYAITAIVMKPGIWIFPNLFEDVGFFDSFVPLWEWDKGGSGNSASAVKPKAE